MQSRSDVADDAVHQTSQAWLLDIYEDEVDGVRLWFITDDGERICLHHSMQAEFFVYGTKDRLHQCCLALHRQAGVLNLSREYQRDVFKPEAICVLRVVTDSPTRQRACFLFVKNTFPDLICYNADLAIHVRHAAVYKTFPMAYCAIEYEADSGLLHHIAVLNTRWDLAPVLPVLRTMELAPVCDPKKNEPSALCVTLNRRITRIALNDADNVIRRLNKLIQGYDPDIIKTQWGDDWLFPKLLTLQETCGITLMANRDPQHVIKLKKEITYYSYGQIVFRAQEIHLFGRCHIDTKNAMMWKEYQLDGTLEMARVTTLPIEQAARVSPGSGISAMQMITALEQNVLVPEQKQQVEAQKTALDLIHNDRGGLIYQPLSGLYTDVAQIDFTSMYPAIIINGNISPEVPLPDGLKPASTELGIVPLTLKPLYEKRVRIKHKLLDFTDKSVPLAKSYSVRAAALKWLLVVCFGFLGYKNARFGRIEAHEAVTRGGREALLIAKEAAEDLGFEVLHMFVDALWIRRPGARSVADFQPVLDEISRRTNMLISLDGVYRWVAFLPSRNNDDLPVPNRYFGAFQDGSLKIRGIESRRRDTPPWIADIQLQMLACLAQAHCAAGLPLCVRKAYKIYQQALQCLNEDHVAPEKLVITMRITRDLDAYKSSSASVRAARQLLELTGKRTLPGQKIRYVYTLDESGVWAWDVPQAFDMTSLDKVRYRELLARAGSTILYPFGIDPTELRDWTQGALQLRCA